MPIETENIVLPILIFVSAVLYSSVGYAGASGYIAIMGLMGVAPATMKPAALILNILVAVSATFKFYRAGAFSWKLFWPLAVSSMPCAYIGGFLALPGYIYNPLIGIILIYAAWRAFRSANSRSEKSFKTAPVPVLFVCGAGIGLLSGLTGIGGGIFLGPLLLFFRWAEPKVISGIAAVFILTNSISSLLGVISTDAIVLPKSFSFWILAAVIGGFIGAEWGSQRLSNMAVQKLLALVLLITGVKMIVMP